jgi:hypothetical protein
VPQRLQCVCKATLSGNRVRQDSTAALGYRLPFRRRQHQNFMSSHAQWNFPDSEAHYFRTPAEPSPPPIKEPPNPMENPDAPVREPDPEEPGQI